MEEQFEPTADDLRYHELSEDTKDHLIRRVMELEDIIDAGEKYMEDEEQRWMKLQKEHDALAEEVRSWNRRGKGHPPAQTGEGIGDPDYYFEKYKHNIKEEVIVQLMKTEALLFECGIIRSAQ